MVHRDWAFVRTAGGMFTIPLIQRYIFAELTRTFFSVLGAVTVLTIFAGVIQQALEKGLSVGTTLSILPYIIPSMMPFTIPAALLLTVCLVYGRISGDHEVTAAKAAGISVMSLLWPALFLGTLLSACSLILTDQVIPWAEAKIEQTIVQGMEDIFFERLRTTHGFSDGKNGLFITVADVDGRTLIQPVIEVGKRRSKDGKKDTSTTLRAVEAKIQVNVRERRVDVMLRDAYVSLPGQQSLRYTGWKKFSLPWDAEPRKLKARYLAVDQIDEEMRSVQYAQRDARDRETIRNAMALTMADFDQLARPTPTGKAIRERQSWYHKLHTEKHSRYALACSCFFFALLGGPFAIWQAKSQFLTTFIFCFGPIVGIYYPIVMGMMTQAKQGNFDPRIAMWIGNALLCAAGLAVLRRVMRF
ncbi:MAG: YjgP/YjgQ family permease [Planctomycetota bacterium]|nr:MAG: YjgP/YjgQ family permease [Planctomycetota bacterium]